MSQPVERAALKPEQWEGLTNLLLDFHAFPGRYSTVMREPRPLFDHATEVLSLAAGRTIPGLPDDEELLGRLREAARFFVRAAMLRPGADHYTLLGVAPGFDPATLRENYRMLIRLTHPDFAAGGGGAWPADAATRINLANDVLASPERRQSYDHAQPRKPQRVPPVTSPVAGRAQEAWENTPPKRIWPAVAGGMGVAALLAALFWPSQSPQERLAMLAQAPAPEPVLESAPAPVVAAPVPALPAAKTVVALAPAPVSPPPAPPPPPPPPRVVTPAPVPVPVPPPSPARVVVPTVPVPVRAVVPAPAPVRVPVPAAPSVAVAAVERPAVPQQIAARSVAPAAPAPVAAPAPAVAMAAVVPPVPVSVVPPPASVAQAPRAPAAVVVAAPAPVPALAAMAVPVVAAASDSPRMVDVQPLLAQLLGALQSGRGDQVIRLVDRSARQGDSGARFADVYNRTISGSRAVKLGPVQFAGRNGGDHLVVDGVVLLHLQDEGSQNSTRELVVRALFALRGGQPVLTQLSASDSGR